ncbi:MAG: site-specific integrase [Magnetococcales bacterium]|nr:site-specific integrase [Magnetococcales bacterium]
MPYQRKNSPIWYASFTDATGRRVRRSTGTTDRKEAEAIEAKWKADAFRKRHWNEEPQRSFDELLILYFTERAPQLRSADTLRHYAKKLRAAFGGNMLESITPGAIRAYSAQRLDDGIKSSTINRELSLLSSAIEYARKEHEWDIANPVTGRKLPEPESRIRWITHAEASKLVAVSPAHLADFIKLALNTGCRRNELLKMEWNRIDLEGSIMYLNAVHTKTGKRRSIPLNPEARKAVLNRARYRAEQCPDSPWLFAHDDGKRLQSVKRSFKTACRKAGIEDFRVHDLRHTCASWLVMDGVPLTTIRDLLGHSSVRMTEKYAHLNPEMVRDAVNALAQIGHRADTTK